MNNNPLFSIILVVKNGMPYIEEALRSLENINFSDYEVIVQDGASTDGTLEVLEKFSQLPLDIVSEKDAGVGDGANKALSRCRGKYIGSIDADNLLDPNVLKKAKAVFQSDPELAAIYFYVRMISHDGKPAHAFKPCNFSLEKLMSAELVPPFSTSFFSRERCGDQLKFDSRIPTCPDFDLWLRLSGLKIKCVNEIMGYTRMSEKSMTCRAESYIQFCDDKIFALDKFLSHKGKNSYLREHRNKSAAGIYLWAAEAIYHIEGRSELCLKFFNKAKKLAPKYSWTKQFEGDYLKK